MKFLRILFRVLAPLAILAAAVAAFLWMGSQPPPARKPADAPTALQVKTVEAASLEGGFEIEADGVVVPLREVTLAAEVGGRVRDGILLKVMGQVPWEMAKNDAFSGALVGVNLPNGLKPKRTWYEYMMVSFGYNPTKSEDRRKFKELGTKAATYTGGAIGVALVQGLASTIAAAIFKR